MRILRKLALVFFLLGFHCAQADNASDIHHQQVSLSGHTVFYNEIGQGSTILLVHGLFANKEQWNLMLPELAKQGFHVVALDLPGYGQSLGFPMKDYDLNQQASLLHEFVKQLGIEKFHIAGNSMGGAISGLYTIQYPKEVLSLAFIGSTLGVKSPIPSEIDKLIQERKDPFVPVNKAQLQRLIHLLFVKPPQLSQAEINADIQENIKNKALKDKIVKLAILPYQAVFDKKIRMQQPVMIFWGNEDNIFNVSGAEKLHHDLDPSSLTILENVGHLPQLECYLPVAKAYTNFLKKVDKEKPQILTKQEINCSL
ncbi:MAG: alpha/beta fold hydrolase [Gammaproteobacteria bacterium]